MKKDYIIKESQSIPYIYDEVDRDKIERNKYILGVASTFITQLLHAKQFYLSITKEEETRGYYSLVLRASSKEKSLTLTLVNNTFLIHREKEEFVFHVTWMSENTQVELVAYTLTTPERKIIQKIKYPLFCVEVQIGDKKYKLEIPYDTNFYFDPRLFYGITSKTTIMDLKRFYKEYFFPNQSDYEKRVLTTISIWQVEEEEILLDKLNLIEGFVNDYYLSATKKGVLIGIEGTPGSPGEIKIKNYQMQEGIDITKTTEKLYKLSKKINFY